MRAHYPSEDQDKGPSGSGSLVLEEKEQQQKPKEPKMWHVFILNDNYTPHFVVVYVIMEVFAFTQDDAIRRMQKAEKTGRALMGTFTKDIAEAKALSVSEVCQRKHGPFPLQAIAEEAPK